MSVYQRRVARDMRARLSAYPSELVQVLRSIASTTRTSPPPYWPIRTTLRLRHILPAKRADFLSVLEVVNEGREDIQFGAWLVLLNADAEKANGPEGPSQPSRAPMNSNRNDDNHDPTKGPDLK